MPQERKREAPSVESDSNDRQSKRVRQLDTQFAKDEAAVEHWVVTDKWGRMPTGPPMYMTVEKVSGQPYSSGSSTETVLSAPLMREERTEPYKDKNCKPYLEKLGVFLGANQTDISKESAAVLQSLLAKMYEDEDSIIMILGDLIVPGMGGDIGDLGKFGFPDLVVTKNETWGDAVPIDASKEKWLPIPQPDYAVGFYRDVLSQAQYVKLLAALGEENKKSLVRMTEDNFFFPFLTAEVNTNLKIAELAGAHSLAVALRGIVALFRLAKREKELHREILAFSVHYNESHVTIYGHFPVIRGDSVQYYRHLIKKLDFQADDGKERWTAYRFVMAVYSDWAPEHLKRICSVVDQMDVDVGAQDPVERTEAIHEFQRIIEENPTKGMEDPYERKMRKKEGKDVKSKVTKKKV
ncbi:hypothetical protein BDV12DRAFT_194088 [Aspergillus spectabilis]